MWWVIGFLAAPALAIFMLVKGLSDLPNAWDAAHGHGQLGTLHVTSKSCSFHSFGGYRCTGLYGDYVSDDESTTVRHVFLDAIPRGAQVGGDVRVRYLAGRQAPVVYKAGGSSDWILIGGLMIAAVITLLVWSATVHARLRDESLPWMLKPWTKPTVIRDERSPDKTGHRRRPRKRRPRR